METIYRITLDNYCGENITEFYHKAINAKRRFHQLCEEGKAYDEYEQDTTSCSWFDPSYNEYSTYIDLEECTLSDVFYDEEE